MLILLPSFYSATLGSFLSVMKFIGKSLFPSQTPYVHESQISTSCKEKAPLIDTAHDISLNSQWKFKGKRLFLLGT